MKMFPGRVELSLPRHEKQTQKAKGVMPPSEPPAGLQLELPGSEPSAALAAEQQLPGVESYFTGPDSKHWHTDLRTFGKLRYRGIYPGIDLAFHGADGVSGQELEYDFELKPQASLNRIAIALRGAESAEIDPDGNLSLIVRGEKLRFLKPVAWQGTERRAVDAAYKLTPAHGNDPARVSFEVANYDPKESLVIDPVLDFATGLNLYYENAMAVDAAGNVYLTGPDPTNPSYAFDVLKFNTAGTLVYTTVISANTSGTYGPGFPADIAVDSAGHAFVAGGASSGWPTTATAYQKTNGYGNGGYYYNAYFVELSTAGKISYASYLGGSTEARNYPDYAVAIAIDSVDNAYILGGAGSSNFPTTAGAYETQLPANGGVVANFIAKFNPSLSGAKSLVYSTLLGDQDAGENAIVVDASGDAYVTGSANSYYNPFPVTPGAFAYNGVYSGYANAYVTKLNSTGTALVYSAYLGPGIGYGIAVDGSGDAYVTGQVDYEDFPTTDGAYQTNYPGGFVTELNPAGSAEIYSTFLSGPSGAQSPTLTTPATIAITPGCASACAAYVAGVLTDTVDFPQINSIQTTASYSSYGGFIAALNGTGSAATLSSYVTGVAGNDNTFGAYSPGATGPSGSPSIGVDASGNIYYAANLDQADYPVTGGAASVFLDKIGPAVAGAVVAYPSTVNIVSAIVNTPSNVYPASSPTVTLRNMGTAAVTLTSITGSSAAFTETNTCGGTIPAGGQCVLTPVFTPAVSGTTNGTLTVASTGTGSPLTINLSGTASDNGFLELLAPLTGQLNFGAQAVGTVSAFQTITVKNSGDRPITSFYIQGLPSGIQHLPSGFAALNNCPATLNAGASCEFGIEFAPYEAGFVTNSFYITYNAPGPNYYFTVTGIGVVSGNPGSIALSATTLNFDTQAVGATSGIQYVSIGNTGAAPVGVVSYATTLTSALGNAADFALTPNQCGKPPYVIQPESSCTFYVSFTPSAVGTETANIRIATSAGTTNVALSGSGSADTQKLVFTPSNYVFSDQVVGTTSTPQAFYVENSGDQTTTIDRVFVTGDFRLQSQNCTGPLTPSIAPGVLGGYCSVAVTFTPGATGNRTGTLTFVDTGAGTAETLSLSGNGIVGTGAITVDTSSLTFPAQAVGTSSAVQYVTFTNPGNTPVTLNSNATTGGDFNSAVYSCNLPYSLGPGQSCSWQVTFTPTSATNPRTGTFTLNTSAGVVSVPLTGTGETATLAVGLTPAAGSTLNFGNVQTGTTSTPMFAYLHNVGTEAVTIPSLATATGSFTVLPGYGNGCGSNTTTLQPGQECGAYVQFSPTANGAVTGTLTFTDSAGTQTLKLSGTGTGAAPTTYFSPAAITFGQEPVGDQTNSYNPYIGTYESFYNNGTASLTIATAQVTAGGANYFISPFTDGCTNGVIASGGACSFQVYFAPTAAGYETGTITLTDTSGKTYTVPLYGYSPSIVDSGYLSPTSVAFPSQALGTTTNSSAIQSIVLTNSGSTTMSVGTIGGTNLGSGTEFPIYSDGCSQTSLAPLTGTCTVNLEFAPSATGARTGQVTIPVTYSDGTIKTFTANLSGTGGTDVSKAVLSPTNSQYPDTAIGAGNGGNYNEIFTLTNVGTLPLIVNYLSGTNTVVGTTTTGDFTTSDGCSDHVVQPAASCAVTVNFAPLAGATGQRSGSLTFPVIYSGATSATAFTATYTGNAVTANKSLVVTPTTAQLGTWIVGTHSTTSTITLNNNGNLPVNLGPPSVSGPFALRNSCSAQLAANGSCAITLVFTPTATGAATGTVTIPNDAPGGPAKVALSGNGIPASQQLAFSQSTVAFGSQLQGTTSNSVLLTLVNQSSLSVLVKSISLGGANVADFTELNDTCTGTTLSGLGYSCTIGIEFTPGASALGAFTASLTENDNGTGGPRSVALSGTSIAPAPSVGLFPNSLAFGNQYEKTQSGNQVFSVTNTGSAALKVTTVVTSDTVQFPITSNACNGKTLDAGADCLVAVAFKPSSTGSVTGAITVTDNATGSPQTLPLSGTGVIPTASLSATSLTFAQQGVGSTSASQSATLTNTGTGTLLLSSVNLGGTNAGDYALTNACGTSLAAGAACTLSVTFTPKATGTRSATVTITDNSGLVSGATQTITLTGTGIPVAATPTFTPAAGTYATAQSVTINALTTGATIYYTTNGTTPTTSSTKYAGTAITVSANETLEAIAVATGYAQSAVATATYAIQAATPTFTPAAGTYTTTQSVTLNDTTTGATIYYTTNGTTPTTASTKYTAGTPISVSATETIEAIAIATGHAQSAVASARYTITPPAATPTFTPAAGTYATTQSVTINDTTTGATIYYTTNGSTPTTASTKYTPGTPISVSATETIEAIAIAPNYSQSAVATATYTINSAAARPTFSLAAGTYNSKQSVALNDATTGAAIYYTTDGTMPTTK